MRDRQPNSKSGPKNSKDLEVGGLSALSDTDLNCAVGALNFAVAQRPARFQADLRAVRDKLRAELARREEGR